MAMRIGKNQGEALKARRMFVSDTKCWSHTNVRPQCTLSTAQRRPLPRVAPTNTKTTEKNPPFHI